MAKIKEETEQLNLRMPTALLEEMDKICAILKVTKSEWIKIKLGELVLEEKSRILEKYGSAKNSGVINKKELEELFK